MAETEISEAQKQAWRENTAKVALQLYDGGVPGINTFTLEVVRANFTPQELMMGGAELAQAIRTKLPIIKPIFTIAVGDAILDSCLGEGTHGQATLEAMRTSYTEMMNELLQKLRERPSASQ